MADSSTDSEVDALLQKIANKLSKSTKKCLKKKKIKKGKTLEEKENVPEDNTCKSVTKSENVNDGIFPLISAKTHTDSHKHYQKTPSGHTKGKSDGKTKTVKNKNQHLFQLPNSNESISDRHRQSSISSYPILYSDASFLEDIGIPLVESTRIHSRESISAMNLCDSSFNSTVSKHSKHSIDDTFETDSYEELKIKIHQKKFDTKTVFQENTYMSSDASKHSDKGQCFPPDKSHEVVTVIPESDDEVCDDKFYSVVEDKLDSVQESSFESSYEIQNMSMQTEEVYHNPDLSENAKNTSHYDTECKNTWSSAEESFVELVDTSMQTESHTKDDKTCRRKSLENLSYEEIVHLDHDDHKLLNSNGLIYDSKELDLKGSKKNDEKASKKFTVKSERSSKYRGLKDHSPTDCKTVSKDLHRKESRNLAISISNGSLPDLDDASFKTCVSSMQSQSEITLEDDQVLSLTNRMKNMMGRTLSTGYNDIDCDVKRASHSELIHKSSVLTKSKEPASGPNRALCGASRMASATGLLDYKQTGSHARNSQEKEKQHQQEVTDGSWRQNKEVSESSEEEDLELFFQKIRSSSKRSKRESPSSVSESDDDDDMQDFIVGDNVEVDDEDDNKVDDDEEDDDDEDDDDDDDKDDDDEDFNHKTPQLSTKSNTLSDSDEEFLQHLTPHVKKSVTPHVKKSVTAQVKKFSQSDSDDENFIKPVTPAVKSRKDQSDKVSSISKQPNGKNYSFLKSLTSDSLSESRRHQDAVKYVTSFKKHKDELTRRLFCLFNETVFENKLPANFDIEWNKRLLRTAGYCVYQKGYHAKIKLSTKVCDSAERVRDTLIHELCHAAVWVLNNKKDGHGAYWKYWAKKANKSHPEIPVIARCHNYSINTKYTYECTQCGYSIGRHSKSLDTENKVCGHCRGRFQVRLTSQNSSASSAAGTPQTPRTPNRFALFVKDHYGELKKKHKSFSHKDIMQTLSKEFQEKNKIVR